jgi:hypothetical protein
MLARVVTRGVAFRGLRCLSASPSVGVLDGSLDKNSDAFKVRVGRAPLPPPSAVAAPLGYGRVLLRVPRFLTHSLAVAASLPCVWAFVTAPRLHPMSPAAP